MNRSALVVGSAVVGGAAVVATTLIVAGTASAVGRSHTKHLTLHATVLKSIEPNNTTSVETDALVAGGKKAGFETQTCTFTQGDKCVVTFALADGILLGRTTSPISTSNHVVVKGTVIGGIGGYAKSRGTFTSTVDGIHATVKVSYHQ